MKKAKVAEEPMKVFHIEYSWVGGVDILARNRDEAMDKAGERSFNPNMAEFAINDISEERVADKDDLEDLE